ncbi:hypothetical protein BRADI_3g36992v3 [Brachypodium distachyon]|uniref:Uncharacterized protein n=1 Tax=Brachypodium distachyon TaxID=15368 RepID=A0A2K2D1N7_BRADI|nr:hypothetical protein BRADI_3g36992v3 [Brachypodium distachyon]
MPSPASEFRETPLIQRALRLGSEHRTEQLDLGNVAHAYYVLNR